MCTIVQLVIELLSLTLFAPFLGLLNESAHQTLFDLRFFISFFSYFRLCPPVRLNIIQGEAYYARIWNEGIEFYESNAFCTG